MIGRARRWAALVFVVGCATAASLRQDRAGKCRSDRDCMYGLVCRGEDDPASRSCVYEEFGRCDDTEKCLAGRVCREHVCTVECVVDADCAEGKACGVGECVVVSDKTECVLAADCPQGKDCIVGRCVDAVRRSCLSDMDCISPQRCFGGTCR